jgi:hypothetical protein
VFRVVRWRWWSGLLRGDDSLCSMGRSGPDVGVRLDAEEGSDAEEGPGAEEGPDAEASSAATARVERLRRGWCDGGKARCLTG